MKYVVIFLGFVAFVQSLRVSNFSKSVHSLKAEVSEKEDKITLLEQDLAVIDLAEKKAMQREREWRYKNDPIKQTVHYQDLLEPFPEDREKK